MHVTFLVSNYAPSVGGAQTLVRRLAEGLVRRHGCTVTVVTTDALHSPGGADPGRVPQGVELLDGVEVIRLPVARRVHAVRRHVRRVTARLGRRRGPSTWSYGPLGARMGVGFWRAAGNSDVVVGVAAPYTTVMAGGLMCLIRSTPFVALPLLHLGKWRPGRSVQRALTRADSTVALTEAERSWMCQVGVDPDRTIVIPLGVDVDPGAPTDAAAARAALGLPEAPTVTLMGRLAPQKGIDTFLDAAAILLDRDPDVRVLLAGSSTGWPGLPDAFDALGDRASRVVLREDFAEDERPTLLAASDVVVMPSREESFGLVILEAWAAQRPVVASDLLSIGSVVREGTDGLLVPTGDVAALADAVQELLDDPARRQRMGAAGHTRLGGEFDWDAVIDRWHDTLHGATTSGRRPRRVG